MQSNEHSLPSYGSRFMPSEVPILRLCTGPKTISLKSIVAILQRNKLIEAESDDHVAGEFTDGHRDHHHGGVGPHEAQRYEHDIAHGRKKPEEAHHRSLPLQALDGGIDALPFYFKP